MPLDFLTGVLTTQINLGIDALTGTDPAAKLAARETIVLNPSLTAVDRSLGPWPDPAEGNFARFMRKRVARLAPRVEIVLYNGGDRTAIVLVAEDYDITLRRRMRVGQAVSSRPLRRKLAPDEPERLEFRFRLPPPDHPLDYRDDNYFYRLDVAVLHDDVAGPVNVGTVVVSLPSGPTEDQIWTRADQRHLQLPSVSVPTEAVACMKATPTGSADSLPVRASDQLSCACSDVALTPLRSRCQCPGSARAPNWRRGRDRALSRRRLGRAGQSFLVHAEQLERRPRARWRRASGDGHERRPPRRRENPPYRDSSAVAYLGEQVGDRV